VLVTSRDGVRLAVYRTGDPGRPTILALHGYPDNHSVWDGVVAILADRYHVVTYDVRGCGASDKPRQRHAYRIDRLVDDLGAVLDAVSPDRPVHLLAHDWGSIQAWPVVCDARFAARIASYTSISGPSLDHAAIWIRAAAEHPGATLRQLLDSYYTLVFQLPVLPELGWRTGAFDRVMALTRGRPSSAAVDNHPARSVADKINGLQLYRANMVTRLRRPRPGRTAIPVQVLAPAEDSYVTPALQTQAPLPYAQNLRARTIPGRHWVVSERPDVIARLTSEFADLVDSDAGGRALGSSPRRSSGSFADRVAVVTGGGAGIGRACALEFARQGAAVVLADINDDAANETASAVRDLGGQATAYHLDVSDHEAWEQFAERVRAEHGVPDVIVNNAGIGMAGPFLSTTVADWDRILGVNLWSVIHGSRLFAAQMVQRGEGGHIVNIASAAAFAPSRIYPAYATTKAAVLMLTECLRAELVNEGIGVTAICPGFINTDISRTTLHVGVDEDTQQSLREHAVASYARRNYPPERVAKHAVRAAARNKPIAAITAESKLLRAITRFAPPVARQLARLDLNKL